MLEKLRLAHIVKSYDDWRLQVDLSVNSGELLSLLGPSGCGKTTTLRIIAGFIPIDAGHIYLDGVEIDTLPPYQRQIGVVFQDYALFPHLDVFHNIAFGMKMKHIYTRRQIRDRVEELLHLVGLDGYEQRHPDQLSGGEQQRIALLRSLAPHPNVLLLDEPLSALDFQLRKRLRREIRNIQRTLGMTTIYVTHDQEEAMSISDRIAVMEHGVVRQIGTPVEIYHSPRTQAIAQFVGMSNVISGTVCHRHDGHLLVQAGRQTFTIPTASNRALNEPVTFFFRPEDSYLSREPQEINHIPGTITEQEYLGAEILTTVQTTDQAQYVVSSYIKNEVFIGAEGKAVCVNFPPKVCKMIESTGQ